MGADLGVAKKAKRIDGRSNDGFLRVFLSYSQKDEELVAELYRRLCDDGIEPWIAKKQLLPGQDRNQKILNAVNNSHIFIACLSKKAISENGLMQRQIRNALEAAQEIPLGSIFVIPLRLEECDIPDVLSNLQEIDYFREEGYDKLIRSFKHRARELGLKFVKDSSHAHHGDLVPGEKIKAPEKENGSRKNADLNEFEFEEIKSFLIEKYQDNEDIVRFIMDDIGHDCKANIGTRQNWAKLIDKATPDDLKIILKAIDYSFRNSISSVDLKKFFAQLEVDEGGKII